MWYYEDHQVMHHHKVSYHFLRSLRWAKCFHMHYFSLKGADMVGVITTLSSTDLAFPAGEAQRQEVSHSLGAHWETTVCFS